MIIIYKQKLIKTGDSIVLSAEFELDERKEELWYKFPAVYEKYLVTERLDAFAVGLLFLGLTTGKDLKLVGSLSARLSYTLNHYLIPALCLANPDFKKIKIISDNLDSEDLNIFKVAGTGISCGIDSFATYIDHKNEKGPNKIEFFTFFNAGSHGDFGGENARKIYYERARLVSGFVHEVNKDLIMVDTNLSEILQMSFQQTHSFRNISCVLNLQKLFKNYYYASAYRFDHFKLNLKDTSDSDIFYLSMLSTESTNLFSSVSQYTRVEKTLLITDYPETYNFLDVCTNPNFKGEYRNCSKCEKCLRTQFTLELFGKLDLYKKVFNLDIYNKEKDKYLAQLIENKNKNIINRELYETLKKYNFTFTFKQYLLRLVFKRKMKMKLLKTKVRYLLKQI